MKKLLIVSAIAAVGFSAAAFAGGLPEVMPVAPVAAAPMASDSGVYVGIAGGYGMTHWKDLVEGIDVNSDNGFIGRAFLGYDINKYFALEGGYTYFFNKTKILSSGIELFKVTTQAIDLVGKIKAPVADNFDVYAKLGGAFYMSGFSASESKSLTGDSNHNNINLVYGAGADYSVTPNVIVNAEWLRYSGNYKFNKEDSKFQPNADAFLLGLRYRFDM